MYSVTETPENKILFVASKTRKIFTTGGKIVKLDSNGIAILPKDAKIGVCKVNHWEQHNIRMTVNRRSLHDDAIAEKYNLGKPIGVDEEEILLASLEVLETL